MNEVKYEPIFGDQSLFDGAPDDAEYAGWFCQETRWYMILNGKILFSDGGTWCTSDNPYLSADIAAMRRITKEPKRWTVEDQKAGKLPKVGSKLIYTETWDEFEFVGVIAGSMRWACKDFQDGFLYFFEQSEMSPIESPEEKARRERDAWARKASEFIDDELDCVNLVGEHVMRRFYNAMLSGDLPVPNKESE